MLSAAGPQTILISAHQANLDRCRNILASYLAAQEEDIAELVFICPNTKTPVSAGILTNYRSIASMFDCPVYVECALCGAEHDFKMRDAIFDYAL
jgi:hypothetical protein